MDKRQTTAAVYCLYVPSGLPFVAFGHRVIDKYCERYDSGGQTCQSRRGTTLVAHGLIVNQWIDPPLDLRG